MLLSSNSIGSGGLCRGGVRLLFTSSTSPVYEIVTAKQTPTSGVAITSRVKKLNFPPFVKDLFCGKFNKSMLSYAEVLNYERHRILEDKIERISTYLNERKTGILNTDGQICPELLVWCRSEGLHGLVGPQVRGGKDLLVTEVARIYEELGRELSLSEFVRREPPAVHTAMEMAERSREPIGVNFNDLDEALDTELRWLLVNYTCGNAEVLVRRVADRTGVETWRLLKSEVEPRGGCQESMNLTKFRIAHYNRIVSYTLEINGQNIIRHRR